MRFVMIGPISVWWFRDVGRTSLIQGAGSGFRFAFSTFVDLGLESISILAFLGVWNIGVYHIIVTHQRLCWGLVCFGRTHPMLMVWLGTHVVVVVVILGFRFRVAVLFGR